MKPELTYVVDISDEFIVSFMIEQQKKTTEMRFVSSHGFKVSCSSSPELGSDRVFLRGWNNDTYRRKASRRFTTRGEAEDYVGVLQHALFEFAMVGGFSNNKIYLGGHTMERNHQIGLLPPVLGRHEVYAGDQNLLAWQLKAF